MAESTPWHNGYWYNYKAGAMINIIEGENVELKPLTCLDHPEANVFFKGRLTSGDFGPTSSEIAEITGFPICNIQWEIPGLSLKMPGVVTNDGTKIYKLSYVPGEIDLIERLDENRIVELKESREPLDAPVLPPYIKPRSNQDGKVVWFVGPGGSGKSVSAQLMAKKHEYVYYEVDCLMNGVNPFIDIHKDNPTFQQIFQQPMKIDQPDVFQAIQSWAVYIERCWVGGIGDVEGNAELRLKVAAQHILQQKQRLGGDFAVAGNQCFTRAQRETLRGMVGEDLVFIVLRLSGECLNKRLHQRHSNSEKQVEILEAMVRMYEEAGDDEQNAFNVEVDVDMTPNDVVAKILEILNSL